MAGGAPLGPVRRAVNRGRGARPARVHWARVPVRIRQRPGRGHWLLARRSISDPGEIAYYACYGL